MSSAPGAGAKREVEDEIGVERMGDATERREPRFVLSALESGDRRLGDAAASSRLRLGQPVLDAEGNELAGNPLVRFQLFQRGSIRRIFPSSWSSSLSRRVGMASS